MELSKRSQIGGKICSEQKCISPEKEKGIML